MSETLPSTVDDFRDYLTDRNADYLPIDATGDRAVTVRFLGNFDQQPVIWHADIITLPGDGTTADDSQYIDIQPGEGDLMQIRIGLRLERIDTPVILKTIIMIRKYKRLRIGRHTFTYS